MRSVPTYQLVKSHALALFGGMNQPVGFALMFWRLKLLENVLAFWVCLFTVYVRITRLYVILKCVIAFVESTNCSSLAFLADFLSSACSIKVGLE